MSGNKLNQYDLRQINRQSSRLPDLQVGNTFKLFQRARDESRFRSFYICVCFK